MINKSKLQSIISKYYLNGLVQSVRWVTEGNKLSISFTSENKDIATGPYIRLHKDSGVVLTEKPFNLKTKNRRRLFFAEADKMDGVLDTTLLQIK